MLTRRGTLKKHPRRRTHPLSLAGARVGTRAQAHDAHGSAHARLATHSCSRLPTRWGLRGRDYEALRLEDAGDVLTATTSSTKPISPRLWESGSHLLTAQLRHK